MWTSTDTPPEPFTLVLVAIKASHEERTEVLVLPHYCNTLGEWFDWQDRPAAPWLRVTHWQPMLSPPEGV